MKKLLILVLVLAVVIMGAWKYQNQTPKKVEWSKNSALIYINNQSKKFKYKETDLKPVTITLYEKYKVQAYALITKNGVDQVFYIDPSKNGNKYMATPDKFEDEQKILSVLGQN